ncbi:MAG: M20/M25/M40 family metallo-hydrolase [bacterium]|nr:M20/M25/M40 family metallo-hydrolase [bacterium]
MRTSPLAAPATRVVLALALAVAIGTSLAAQGTTSASSEVPDLGEPTAAPDGAPEHLKLIDRQGLAEHAYWLASDERQGRFTSSAGQRATADYVAAHFKKLGLRPLGDKRGFLQKYPLTSVHIAKGTQLSFGRTKITTGFAVLPSDDSFKASARGKFAWCGNGTGNSLPSLKGKIPLVVLHGLGSGTGSGNDLRAIGRYNAIARKLASKGAAAGLICLLDDGGSHANTLSYHGLLPDHPKLQFGKGGRRSQKMRIPLFVINGEQSRALFEHVGIELDGEGEPKTAPKNNKATGSLKIQVKESKKAFSTNVVAVLDGADKKNEAIVYSAHHDHMGERVDGDAFNGADDNASGTAGLLEIAEAFAKGGPRPSRSVIFLSVSGEELGLWGSEYFAENSPWPRGRIVANINIDMIGRAEGTDEAPKMQITPSHGHQKYSSMVRDAVELGEKFGISFTSGDQYYQRSDHYNFAKHGIPVVFFCDGEHPDYHQVTDHPDKLRYPAMESIARLAFWTGWNVANANQRPKELGRQSGW